MMLCVGDIAIGTLRRGE